MITLSHLQKYKQNGRPFSCLTCYDASFAHLMAQAGIDLILIGDSLGMVVQGKNSTVPVTVKDIAYHTQNVAAMNSHAFLMADMPFMSYADEVGAISAAKCLMQAGAMMVKIEGDARLCPIVERLTQAGAPVCVHLGLTPQMVHLLGGYKVQGKTPDAADALIESAKALVHAGASMLLVECIPASLGTRLSKSVEVPVIGIGAGAGTDAQVLVMHDMLGVYTRRPAKFVKNFLVESASIQNAFEAYHQAVISRAFPTDAHTF